MSSVTPESSSIKSGHVLGSLFLVSLVVLRPLFAANNGNQCKLALAKKKFRNPRRPRQLTDGKGLKARTRSSHFCVAVLVSGSVSLSSRCFMGLHSG